MQDGAHNGSLLALGATVRFLFTNDPMLVASTPPLSLLCPRPPSPTPPWNQVFTELGILVDAAPHHQVVVSAAVRELLRRLPGVAAEPVACSVAAFRLTHVPDITEIDDVVFDLQVCFGPSSRGRVL